MSDRQTTLVIGDEETQPFDVPMGIPQGSPLSPILFLFYNAELLEMLAGSSTNISNRTGVVGFVDDVNILVYGPTTEDNCNRLQGTHDK